MNMLKKKMLFASCCLFSLLFGFLGGYIYSTQNAFVAMSLLQEADFATQLSRTEEAYDVSGATALWALKNALRTLDDIRDREVISERHYNGERFIILSRILHFEIKEERNTEETMDAINLVWKNLGSKDILTTDSVLEKLYSRDATLRAMTNSMLPTSGVKIGLSKNETAVGSLPLGGIQKQEQEATPAETVAGGIEDQAKDDSDLATP